jgi:hypothetical protein
MRVALRSADRGQKRSTPEFSMQIIDTGTVAALKGPRYVSGVPGAGLQAAIRSSVLISSS